MSGEHGHLDHVHLAEWLVAWDARARLTALLALAAATALSTRLVAAGLGGGFAFALLILGDVPARYAFARLRWLILFLAPVALTVPFHRVEGAAPLFDAWPSGPTGAGARAAALIALRVVGASAAALLALGSGPFDRTAKGLQDLGLPRVLVRMALLAYRYVFVFRDDLAHVGAALSSRAFVPRADGRTARTLGRVAGGLLVRSVERTERLDQAMRCRGFEGRLRTLSPHRMRLGDLARALAVIALAALVVVVDREVALPWPTR